MAAALVLLLGLLVHGSSLQGFAVAQSCNGVTDAEGLFQGVASGALVVNVCTDIGLASQVNITKTTTIIGLCPSPGCRIYATRPIRLFEVTGGAVNATFRNLWLDGGNATAEASDRDYFFGSGSAIRVANYGGLVCDTVLFTDNVGVMGGAIRTDGVGTSIVNCTFFNNTATYYAAAVSLSGTSSVNSVRNTSFIRNHAPDGGALYSSYSDTAIRGCLFLYNSNNKSGSAVSLYGPGDSKIVGNTFANNTAVVSGGGLLVRANFLGFGRTIISGNLFTQNYDSKKSTITDAGGNAVFISPNVFLQDNVESSQVEIYVDEFFSMPYSTIFCPSRPDGVVNVTNTLVNTSCDFSSCTLSSPCDPRASCTLVEGVPICSCPTGMVGNGWICESSPNILLAVGAGTIGYTVPPFQRISEKPPLPTQVPTPAPSQATSFLPPSPSSTVRISEGKRSRLTLIWVLGLSVPAAFIATLVICIICYKCRIWKWRAERPDKRTLKSIALEKPTQPVVAHIDMTTPLTPSPNMELGESTRTSIDKAIGEIWRRFSYAELGQATNHFSRANLLGEGAYGTVYLGAMPDGMQVAVKQLKSGDDRLGEKDFITEWSALSRLRHRNLVSLQGYCVEGRKYFLVLDYATNGNLDAALRNLERPLDWETRITLAVGAARGLSYLHNDATPPIVHRDIKPTNILLDSKLQAQVADFGLAKLLDENATHCSTVVRGTYGYIAPECVRIGQVMRALEQRQSPLLLMDSKLDSRFPPEAATTLIGIALACVAQDDRRRPDMAEVLFELENLARGAEGQWFKPVEEMANNHTSGSSIIVDPQNGADTSGSSANASHSTGRYPSSSNPGSDQRWMQSVGYEMSMLKEGR